ncbi:OmpA family protein [Lichenicola sp.]|uniref:OmpA family protein n=1 Tax=Lichenicola sp. TaxID=2804529 RepID=UPI003B00BBB0
MRSLNLGLSFIGLLGVAISPAAAQVTTNRSALDALGSGKPAAHATATHHPARPAHTSGHGHASAHNAATAGKGSAHKPAAKSGRPPPAATIPAAPPPPPVFRAPVINVPLHPPPPPPPVPVVQGAGGTATPIDGGTRITFGAASADLNPTTMQALQNFAAQLKADPLARADLEAYGLGTPEDPSTPRRMALSRGLAARAVLINEGIPSTRIYVRVIGQPTTGDTPSGATPSVTAADTAAPADRVDLHLSRNPGDTAVTPIGAPPAGTPPAGMSPAGTPAADASAASPDATLSPAPGPTPPGNTHP